VPQELRREPNSVAESRQAATDPRARLFVLFLDTYHVEAEGSSAIKRPLVEALDGMIAENDLVAVMTPQMSAGDVTFARRTTTIESLLTRYWYWGERGRLNPVDPIENQYRSCYPNSLSPQSDAANVVREMIDRRHERLTLDALRDLVIYLRGVREERKAVLAITDGWLLFQPNPRLTRPIDDRPPPVPTAAVDPRNGRLTTRDPSSSDAAWLECERDRILLSQIDDERTMREILDDANRANASFYPVDPRGLVVFDSPIGPDQPPPVGVDNARLRTRSNSLRRLAEGTDGLAIVGSNNLGNGLRRVIDDLSSYYLLGYYSTGRLDGKFHSITVRVKRPGVQVRARRGYLAANAAEVEASARSIKDPRPPSPADAMAGSAAAAIATLASVTRDQPFRAHATAGWRPGAGAPTPAFWLVGEVADRLPGSDLDIVITGSSGETISTAHARIEPGTTGTLVRMAANAAIEPGSYTVRVRSQSPSGSETLTLQVALLPAPRASDAVLIRRGPSTGNKDMPTADRRLRRGDRLRIDMPSIDALSGAHLLDRTGKLMPIPVSFVVRDDPDGTRWASAEVALAPLAPGDYLIELAGREARTLIAFRVVP
jgi:VWFA-related protein